VAARGVVFFDVEEQSEETGAIRVELRLEAHVVDDAGVAEYALDRRRFAVAGRVDERDAHAIVSLMRLHVGTSGYSYAEWKGTFYPKGMPAAEMLAFYAAHFDTVEINNTFYRMPKAAMLETWAAQVPPHFLFALKAPQWITFRKDLAGAADGAAQFRAVAATLGPRLGPLLFRIPPFLEKDVAKLETVLAALPYVQRVALEFLHKSWFDD